MPVERYCGSHCVLLDDDLICSHQHGTRTNKATKKREPNFETDSWVVVEDGIVTAEVVGDHYRELRPGKLEEAVTHDVPMKGRRPYTIDMGLESTDDTASRRRRERKRAEREQRKPAAWAMLDTDLDPEGVVAHIRYRFRAEAAEREGEA